MVENIRQTIERFGCLILIKNIIIKGALIMKRNIELHDYSADEWYDLGRRHNSLKTKLFYILQTICFYYRKGHTMYARADKLHYVFATFVADELDSAICKTYTRDVTRLPGYDVKIINVFYKLYDEDEQREFVNIDRGKPLRPLPCKLEEPIYSTCKEITTNVGLYVEEVSDMLKPKTLSAMRRMINKFWK